MAGYYEYKMSNNAVMAYENGEKPLSKWTKMAIIKAVSEMITIWKGTHFVRETDLNFVNDEISFDPIMGIFYFKANKEITFTDFLLMLSPENIRDVDVFEKLLHINKHTLLKYIRGDTLPTSALWYYLRITTFQDFRRVVYQYFDAHSVNVSDLCEVCEMELVKKRGEKND